MQGLGLGTGARTRGLRRPRQLHRGAHRPRVLAQRRRGCSCYGAHPRADHARPGAAVRAAAGLAPHGRARRFSRIAIFLPYAVPGVIAVAAVGLPLPARRSARSTTLLRAARLGRRARPARRRAASSSRSPTSRVWGGVGFNMIVHLHRRCGRSRASSTRRPASTAAPSCRSRWRIKIPMLTPALIMTALFSMIATLQVFSRADHAAAADQRALDHLDAR